MSVSKWAYEPSRCDGDYCCGDCDHCQKAENVKKPNEYKTLLEVCADWDREIEKRGYVN